MGYVRPFTDFISYAVHYMAYNYRILLYYFYRYQYNIDAYIAVVLFFFIIYCLLTFILVTLVHMNIIEVPYKSVVCNLADKNNTEPSTGLHRSPFIGLYPLTLEESQHMAKMINKNDVIIGRALDECMKQSEQKIFFKMLETFRPNDVSKYFELDGNSQNYDLVAKSTKLTKEDLESIRYHIPEHMEPEWYNTSNMSPLDKKETRGLNGFIGRNGNMVGKTFQECEATSIQRSAILKIFREYFIDDVPQFFPYIENLDDQIIPKRQVGDGVFTQEHLNRMRRCIQETFPTLGNFR